MITQIAETMSTFFYRTKIIELEEKEKSRYGMEIIISTIIGFGVIIATGSILGHTETAVVYLLCIVPIRMYTGGYHANTYLKCNTVFAIVFLANILIYDYIIFHGLEEKLLLFTLFASVPIKRYAPVEHGNKKMTMWQKQKYKKISVFLFGFYYLVSVLLLENGNQYGILVLLVLNTVTILVLEVKISERIKTQNIRAYC